MMDMIVKVLVASGIMGILDFVWLGFIAKKLYASELGSILLEKPNMIAALLFYLIYMIGVIVFVINPAQEKSSLVHAIGFGALFGLVAYATYDLTNLAVVKGFSVKIVVIDLLWGMLLTATVSAGIFRISANRAP